MNERKLRSKYTPRIERFLTKFKIDPTGCHLWTAGSHKKGDGNGRQAMFHGERGNTPAYRWYYQYLHNVTLPRHIYVCHTCDNEMCVNPEHLFLGTALDNNRDCVSKARNVRGERQHLSKLTELQVRVIKEAIAQKFTDVSIARYFKVCDSNINAIRLGKIWKHVTID